MEEEICKHFKYGYCKFKDECRKHHVKDICELGTSCKMSKVCPKRHPKTCKKAIFEGFCRHGDHCAYSHSPTTNDQRNIGVIMGKVETLEKIVQEMAQQIISLQAEIHAQKDESKTVSGKYSKDENNVKDQIETLSIKTKSSIKRSELKEKEQLNCEHCDYYCKKTATMNKHMVTKHAMDRKEKDKQISSCNQCEEKFKTLIELQIHIANKHSDEDGEMTQEISTPSYEHESSFVFSESMLDEFVDKNFLNGV